MAREAHVAVWLAHLLAVEADHADDVERERLLRLRADAYDLASELLGATDATPFFVAMDEWDRAAGSCQDCGQHWAEMRHDGEHTARAGHWLQRIESRTCACGRTISRLLEERDVQDLGDGELEAFIADRVSVFAAERDQRPSEVPTCP